MKNSLSAFLVLSGRNDHAGIWHGNTDTGNNLGKGVVVNTVVKGIRVDIIGSLYPGHTDGMGSYPVYRLQMLRVHQQSCKLIAVHFQSEEHAAANVVNTALHSPVHSLCMIVIIMLWSCGMELQIAFLMVGLLEEDIGSDPGFLQFSVIFHRGGRYIDIYPSDSPVFMFNAVDGLNTFQHILDRIVYRIFACLQSQSLMSHILKSDNFLADLLLGQLLSGDMFVLSVIRTVHAAVYTVIRQI